MIKYIIAQIMAKGTKRDMTPPIATNKASKVFPNITIIPMTTNIIKITSIILFIL